MKLLTSLLMAAVVALTGVLPTIAVADNHHGREGGGGRGGDARAHYGAPPAAGYGGGRYGGAAPRFAPVPGYGRAPRYAAPPAPGPAPGDYGHPPGYGAAPGYGAPRYREGPQDYAPAGRFRRGQFLPQAERGYVIGDYYRYHLRRPPPGYYWYRNGDDFVLAAIASGLIFEVVAGDGY